MAEQEETWLTSSHGHTKITTIYRATNDENDLQTSRKDLLQLAITIDTKKELQRDE